MVFEVMQENLIHIKKTWWFLPDWVMALGCVITGIFLFVTDSDFVRLIWLLATVYFAGQVHYRYGVYYGFAEGFQVARETGKSEPDTQVKGTR